MSIVENGSECVLRITLNSLVKLFEDVVKIDSPNYKELRKKFLSNYFDFAHKYKKITMDYYDKFYFIFNEFYIDDFISNNFDGISWYLKKNWNLFPTNVITNIKL